MVGDPRDEVEDALTGAGWRVARWNRVATSRAEASTAPPEGEVELVALRLDKSKEATEFALHMTLGRLRPGGRALLYGAKDEGIRSGDSRIRASTGPWETVATGGHCRVLEWKRPSAFDPGARGLRQSIEAWRTESPEGRVSWPGVFGGERLDPGTALLGDSLRETPLQLGGEGPVLDFGAGGGALSVVLVETGFPPERLALLEPDALAAEAARRNVAGARIVVRAGWPGPDAGGPWSAVVSNPPYHAGKAESLTVVKELIDGASADLAPGGELRIVVQRRLPVESLLRPSFVHVDAIADDGPYRVWRARSRTSETARSRVRPR